MPFRSISTPILRAVPDVQDFHYFIGITVHHNVRAADKLAGSFNFSRSAQAWEGGQLFNTVDDRLGDISSGGRIVFLDAFNSGYKLVGGFGCPPNLPHE